MDRLKRLFRSKKVKPPTAPSKYANTPLRGSLRAKFAVPPNAKTPPNTPSPRRQNSPRAPNTPSPRRQNSPRAPNTPNVLEKRNNISVVVTVPLSATEKTVVVARFQDARHLIKTVLINMPRDANVVAKYGSKKDVAHHQELLDTVRRYDRALKTQRTAWKPYLGSASGGNTKRVTLPNWPVTAFSSVLVKNRRYVTNTREVGLAPNVQRTLTNTGQVVNTVIRKLTPDSVIVAMPLTPRQEQNIENAFDTFAAYMDNVMSKVYATPSKNFERLPEWEKKMISNLFTEVEYIWEKGSQQYREWIEKLNRPLPKSARITLPNWPVTPLTMSPNETPVGYQIDRKTPNRKTSTSIMAPDVQRALRSTADYFDKLLRKH